MALKPLNNTRPFIKFGIEGFEGSGKTYLLALLGIWLHKRIESKKPILIFDTERAFSRIKHLFEDAGIDVLIEEDEDSVTAWGSYVDQAENDGIADIILTDSLSHIWGNLVKNYLKQKKKTSLEMIDWTVLKPMWKEQFARRLVKANVHILCAGRAGYEYSDERDERGKWQAHKTGVKMAAENQTAFEFDILCLAERIDKTLDKKSKKTIRRIHVLKDRTTKIDGMSFDNATAEDFAPAFDKMLDGTVTKSEGPKIADNFEDAEEKHYKNRLRRDTAISEIEAAFQLLGWGNATIDKQRKVWILKQVFGVGSLDSLKPMAVDKVEAGQKTITAFADAFATYVDQCANDGIEVDPSKAKEIILEVWKGEVNNEMKRA
jgi:hypothetical protein